ncbi:hypothetical protein MGH68_03855 [Erysipelothrix sp. D19-032]
MKHLDVTNPKIVNKLAIRYNMKAKVIKGEIENGKESSCCRSRILGILVAKKLAKKFKKDPKYQSLL